MVDASASGGAREPVGSFADEASRLADAVSGWARGDGGGRVSSAVGHMATGDPACCVCPLCNVIVVLRGERPELTSRLVESLTGLVTAGQGLLDTLSAVAAEARSDDSAAHGNDPTRNSATGSGFAEAGAANNVAEDNGRGGSGDASSPRVQPIPLDDRIPFDADVPAAGDHPSGGGA